MTGCPSSADTSSTGKLWQKARAWYWASRPFTLPASVVPVLVGSALAFQEGKANPGLFVLVLVASMLVQITTNLVDEYSDHARPEGKEKLLAPYKVIARGELSAKAVKRGALVCFGLATAIGLYLIAVAGWPILAICAGSGVVAYLYAGGPKPLGTLGLGQPLVFVFMGPVMVMGAYYVQARAFTLDGLLLSVPLACTVTAILAANDLRDLEEDRTGGKTTPVTLFGRKAGRWEWTMLVAAAFVIVAVLALTRTPTLLALVVLLSLPEAWKAYRLVWRGQDRASLAPALRETARLHGYLGVLLSLGVAMGRFTSF